MCNFWCNIRASCHKNVSLLVKTSSQLQPDKISTRTPWFHLTCWRECVPTQVSKTGSSGGGECQADPVTLSRNQGSDTEPTEPPMGPQARLVFRGNSKAQLHGGAHLMAPDCFSPRPAPPSLLPQALRHGQVGGGQEPLRGADSLFRCRPVTPCLGCPLCPRRPSTRVS